MTRFLEPTAHTVSRLCRSVLGTGTPLRVGRFFFDGEDAGIASATRPIGSQPIVFYVAVVWLASAGLLPAAIAGELRIFPREVVLSSDYPAQVIVLEEQADGTCVDQTRSRDMQWKVNVPELVRVADGGLIEAEATASPAGGEGQLTVLRDGQEVRVPIRVLTGEHVAPIFPREVAAVLGKAGCNLGTCHGNLHGKGGFRLSLRGDDSLLDYASIVRASGGRRVDRFDPSKSLLVRKPLGQVAHLGGARFDLNSPEARILKRWIEEGCRWNAASGASVPGYEEPPRPDETVIGLDVYPAEALLAHNSRSQQLSVTARFADGTIRDVTRWARFEPSVVTGVEISPAGLVQASRPTDVSISISYLTGRTASRLTFLAHDQSQWSEPAPHTRLDELVEQHLRKLQLQPSAPADDYVFVRRAYLAIVGRLPTADEVRSFAGSASPDKDAQLVETLLNDPGYALLWALRWSDVLRNEQKVMSPRGAQGWHAWMADQIAVDRPLNEMVAQMLTTLGSTYEHPAASFHRTHRDPETAAESVGQVFLGVRLQCARCHNHPFDSWRQDDYYGLAAYFTTLERKQIDNSPRDKFDKHIISGDEVVSLRDNEPKIWHPGRAAEVGPKPLTEPSLAEPQDDEASKAKTSPLERLAEWLTVGNRMFARNMANRIWFHYMGVGIVDPPDDFRDSNPPSNPELLEYLTDELIRSDYSVRHVARLIVTSRTFRRQSAAEPSATEPLGGARVFSGYPLRRMQAEILYDAVSDATGVISPFVSDERKRGSEEKKGSEEANLTTLGQRAVARVEVPTRAGFLTTFGKPGRLLACECERSSEVSLGQSLVLVNGLEPRTKLADSHNRLTRLADRDVNLQEALEELYLATLSRPPRADELEHFTAYINESLSRRGALEDVLWALLNSKEFPLIR